jgi:hypothetical protein
MSDRADMVSKIEIAVAMVISVYPDIRIRWTGLRRKGKGRLELRTGDCGDERHCSLRTYCAPKAAH